MTNIYLKNAAILTAASLVLRAAGMGLRVLLAAHLGSEGMGLYQLVFTAYGVCIAMAVGGLSVASTRLSAQALAQNDRRGVCRLMQRLIGMGAVLGCTAAAVQYLLANVLARWLLGDLRAAAALQILAFSLPFMAVGAAIRGYFMAARNVRPNVAAQLAEQAVRIAVIVFLLHTATGAEMPRMVALVTMGNTLSEAISCLWMLCFWRGEKRALQKGFSALPTCVPGWGKVMEVFLPVEGNRLVSSLLRTAETSLVPACLALYAGSRSMALSQFGALRGMAMPLLTFPFSFLATLSGLLMPEIARAHTAQNKSALQSLVGRTMAVTLGISLFAGAFFTLWAVPLAQLIYRDAEVGQYLAWLGPIVPFMYLESMVDGIMKGIGEQLASFRYEMLNSALRLSAILFLLPRFGIAGYAAIVAASNVFTCLLNLRRMLQVLQMRFCWGEWLVRPGLILLASLLVCMAAQGSIPSADHIRRLFVAGGAMALSYAVLLWPLCLRRHFAALQNKKV